MRILALDTATAATAVALLELDPDGHERRAVERRDDPPPGTRPRHTPALLSLVVDAMDAAGAGWGDLDLIAVGTGPGTFTGLRIGIATARALARARDVALVGVSTLRSLAAGAAAVAATEDRLPLAVLDARRGEAFAAAWAEPARAGDGSVAPLLGPVALAPQQLAESVRDHPRGWLAVGDGALRYRPVLEHVGVAVAEDGSRLHRVSALEHCRLATSMRPQHPDLVVPDYLRVPDAELALRARSAAVTT